MSVRIEGYNLPYEGEEVENLLEKAEDLGDATTTKAGLMSAADKVKLNGIPSGAEENVVKTVDTTAGNSGVNLSLNANGKLDVSITKGSVESGNTNFVTGGDVHTALQNVEPDLSGYYTKTESDGRYLQSYTETDPNVPAWAKAAEKPTYTAQDVGAVPTTRTVNGKALSENITLTASDVGALPSDTVIPDAQIQSDWEQSDTTAKDFIKNKPTIPDAQVQSNWNESDTTSKAYIQNKPTIPVGIPSGGNSSQILKKASGTDYDVAWGDQTQIYPSGHCVSGGSRNPKVVNLSSWTATANTYFTVVMGVANTVQGAITMKVNGQPITGAPIYINGEASSATNYTLPAGSYIVFWDGTNFHFRTDGTIPSVGGEIMEDGGNKVTAIDSQSTDTQYPSAKCVYDALSGKQDTLVSGTSIKTVNGESVLGSGNISVSSGGGGDANVIESITFNGSSVPVDVSKNAAITYSAPVTSVNGNTGAVTLSIPSAPGTLNTTATTAQATSSSEALSGSVTLHKVAKTGAYSDLIGTPTIPTVPTISTDISEDATSDTKTASPKAVKTFVEGKGYLTSETEPSFTGSAAFGITSSDISAWNGKSTFSGSYTDLTNKPTLGTAAALDVAASGDASTSQVVKGDDTRLSDARTPTTHSHTVSQITDFPSNLVTGLNSSGVATAYTIKVVDSMPGTTDASTIYLVTGS